MIHDALIPHVLEYANDRLRAYNLPSALTVQNYNYIRSSSYIDTERVVYTVDRYTIRNRVTIEHASFESIFPPVVQLPKYLCSESFPNDIARRKD